MKGSPCLYRFVKIRSSSAMPPKLVRSAGAAGAEAGPAEEVAAAEPEKDAAEEEEEEEVEESEEDVAPVVEAALLLFFVCGGFSGCQLETNTFGSVISTSVHISQSKIEW